jgi:glycosyltransferase involved in cell wall biosynthesis
MLSIVISVFNGENYISKTLESIISQEFKEYECIIIDDGSIDSTKSIVSAFIEKYKNFRYYYKENGGYVSARNFGFSKVKSKSEFVHFMDADDILLPGFYSTLLQILDSNNTISAVCSNHLLIDELGNILGSSNYSPFVYPTRLWIKKLNKKFFKVPFISIFCWAKIIEPMVVMRKSAYEKTSGWDARFGKGKGNIGDGVILFGEMALQGEIWFLNEELYLYRKHLGQSTSDAYLNLKARSKAISIWKEKCDLGILTKKELLFSILFFETRVNIDSLLGNLKHELRFEPIKFIKTLFLIIWYMIKSFPLLFFRKKTINRIS